MQLIDYVTILRRRWWVILLVAAVAAVAAYGFSKFQPRIHRAEATYSLQTSRLDASLTQVLQNRMANFRDTALAPFQLERISNELKIDRSADWLLDKVVSMQARPDEQKMIVRVDYPDDGAMAVKLADAVGQNMVALVTQQNSQIEGTDKIYMSVQQPARYLGIISPNTKINVAAGGLLGLILGLLLAFVLEALDNTLKTAVDVDRFVGLTTLGAIPTAGHDRRGAKDAARRAKDDRRPLRAQR